MGTQIDKLQWSSIDIWEKLKQKINLEVAYLHETLTHYVKFMLLIFLLLFQIQFKIASRSLHPSDGTKQ